MAISISNAAAIAALDPLLDLVDFATPGALNIYAANGAGIVAIDVAITDQTLVAACPLNATGFAGATDGAPGADAAMNTASPVEDTTATAGTMAWFRIVDGNGLAVLQGTVGTSGEDINFNTVTVATNDTVTVTGLTITLPEA